MRSNSNAKSSLLALLLALAGLSALASVAEAAGPAPGPAWGVLAAVGPTNLPPKQSEVQRVTVEGEAGTFTLTHKSGEGTGTPVTQTGVLSLEGGSAEVKILTGSYEVGQRLSGTRIPPETTILACSSDCHTAGSKLTLSKAAEENGNSAVTIFTKKLSGASATSGSFHVGDILSGKGIAPETTITAVEGATLTTTKATTAAYSSGAIALTLSEAATAPFDASAEELQGALEALPAFAPESFTVTGGPGGEVEHPYLIAFGGPEFANQDVEKFTAEGQGLGTHGFVHVFTTVPGGPGTGEIGVISTNRGGGPSHGEATVEVGPLPAGIVATGSGEEDGWTCTIDGGGRDVACTKTTPVPAFEQTSLRIAVEVVAGTPFEASAPVRVSGGGGGEAGYQLPIVVSNQPAAGGIGAFTFGAYEADGAPSTQAGAHPYSTSTEFVLDTVRVPNGKLLPAGDAREVIVDLPAGFVGNPLVVERCPQSAITAETSFQPSACLVDFSIGTFAPKVGFAGTSMGAPIWDNVPPYGTAAAFASKIISPVAALFGYLRSEDDFGVRIIAPNAATQLSTVYSGFTVFLGFPAAAHGVPFFTNASDCAEQARKQPELLTEISTWQHPDEFTRASTLLEPVSGCDKLEFHGYDPKTEEGQVAFGLQPTSHRGSSPVGADAHLHLDQSGLTDPDKLAAPPLKRSVVKLPPGLTINPSQANGLEACSEAQIGYKGEGELPNPTRFNNDPAACPDGSKLGTAEATTPLLDEPLKGTIYLARQNENPFHTLIAMYLVFESPRFGITLKLPGRIDPDPSSGQLTATFDYLPQQPVEDFTLHFRGGGPRSELATPEVCGKYTTTGEWEPWSAPESGPPAHTSDSFTVSGNCASSSGARPFSPSFEAGTIHPIAGGFSPLVVKIRRKDGEQELSHLDFTMPPGFTGKIAGIPYCSEAQIAVARSKRGRSEQASPSCPAGSHVGSIDAAAGVGSDPYHVGGELYLAGPYRGAPLSAVAITPAVAGPFDLGNVVIRTPLYVDENTAQITAKSDPIPTILEGIPLKVREVSVSIDRPDFTLNPTSCEAMQVTASLGSSDGATATPHNRFQVGGCEKLSFKPKTYFRLYGGTRRGANPKLRAIYETKPGEANLVKGAFTIPRSEFLDQAHIRTICTRVQFAASACPKGSIYGHVKAFSPIVDYPVSGPVYLRSSDNELPDMIFDLHGPAYQPVRVVVALRIDSVKGQIRATVEDAPDLPVSKLIFIQKGGKKGLLVNSRNICKRRYRATVKTVGHNGKRASFRPVLSNSRCGKGRKAKRGHGRHRRRHNG